MIIGVDLEKNERVLYDAYNDAAGVTARFNLNVLVRINRELGGNFDVSAFMHRSVYNRERHRIEMHLIAKKAQTVRILGAEFFVPPGRKHPHRVQLQIQPRPLHRAGARLRLVGTGILDRPRPDVFGSRAGGVRLRSGARALLGRHVLTAPALRSHPRDGAIRGAADIQSSNSRSAPSNHAWMIRHLSCPRDWKSNSANRCPAARGRTSRSSFQWACPARSTASRSSDPTPE